jgi:hypothetical protein
MKLVHSLDMQETGRTVGAAGARTAARAGGQVPVAAITHEGASGRRRDVRHRTSARCGFGFPTFPSR